jgi:hypothetical protein
VGAGRFGAHLHFHFAQIEWREKLLCSVEQAL